ncbi:MAG: type 2 isopentenyl-diphosphate Delta-isomerase [Bdellovibrio sp. CG10_big_fil_rev_8_21_14_0_10_47_8]|nr:MAG: type 2 isopentenyl-diphosphate Delta-isomerase [Bdellovibrio sp. CG10_big_fil_rev_8_21_14_0_10_47_8]
MVTPADQQGIFEQRKRDHIRLALDPRVQTQGMAGFDRIQLVHEALPNLDFSEINLQTKLLGQDCSCPLYISSMTAGHTHGELINARLSRLSHDRQILMGVGSQRKELFDPSAGLEWKKLRAQFPKARWISNIGIAQLIMAANDMAWGRIQGLVDSLESVGLFVHLNALQECLQPEGTPQFKGGLQALEKLVKTLSVPVIVKEVGCGFSAPTLQRLENIGVQIVDVSGMGGTHWGRIEGLRADEASVQAQAAQTFQSWGISTVESLISGAEVLKKTEMWASGGVRCGLDAVKALSMGAKAVGVAQPFLQAALESEAAVDRVFTQLEFDMKVALFCTGVKQVADFAEIKEKKIWTWK